MWLNKSLATINIILQPYPQFKKNSLQCKLKQPKSKTKENINPSIAIDKNLTIISRHGNTGQKFLT